MLLGAWCNNYLCVQPGKDRWLWSTVTFSSIHLQSQTYFKTNLQHLDYVCLSSSPLVDWTFHPPLFLSSLLLLCFLCLSWLVSFCFWFSWLGPMCVFRALVVVCNESHINAACCHMRDQSTTSNKEQMDTRVCLLDKYFPLMLHTPLLLSERE